MAVVARKRKSGVIYGVSNEWNGKPQWELVGPNKREAQIRDRAMKREIEAGTYMPKTGARATTFGAYCRSWVNARTNASSDSEERLIRLHVESRPWLSEKRIDEIGHNDRIRLVSELRSELRPDGQRRLTDKTIGNIIGLLHRIFKDAILADLAVKQPFTRVKGELDTAPAREVEIYQPHEVVILTRHHSIPWPIRVLNALCCLAGLREGEAVGLRWRDLDTETKPLASLTVARQYEGRKLKTKRPRLVPVHPELWAIIEAWGTEGFEVYTGQKPSADDFIVPNCSSRAQTRNHTRSSYYKQFVKHAETAGVRPRSLHSTRHTFITLCRRFGARADVLERVTHNACGKMIDRYTHFDFDPLCEAVMHLRLDAHRDVPRVTGNGGKSGPRNRFLNQDNGREITNNSQPEALFDSPRLHPEIAKNSREKKPRQDSRQESAVILDDLRAANRRRKRRLFSLQEVDPEEAGPGLAVCRGFDAALRLGSGDESATDDLRAELVGASQRFAGGES